MNDQNTAPINYFALTIMAAAAYIANVALATGRTEWQEERDEAAKALRVARQAGTAVMLAHAKSFGDLTAYTEHTDAMLASVARMKDANGRAVKVDSTYRTAVMQVRGAAKALGWQAVQDATSIGKLYAAKRTAEATSRANEPKDNSTGLSRALSELHMLLWELDDSTAEGLVAGWIAQLVQRGTALSDTMPAAEPQPAVVNG